MIVSDISNELYLELGEPSDISIPSLNFWLESNIGTLNSWIGTSFSIDGGVFNPDIDNKQKDIFKGIYYVHYWLRKANQNLGAAAYNAFSEWKEGNRTVKRTNQNDIAKNYLAVWRGAKDDLRDLILAYKLSISGPAQVTVANPIVMNYYKNGCRNSFNWFWRFDA